MTPPPNYISHIVKVNVTPALFSLNSLTLVPVSRRSFLLRGSSTSPEAVDAVNDAIERAVRMLPNSTAMMWPANTKTRQSVSNAAVLPYFLLRRCYRTASEDKLTTALSPGWELVAELLGWSTRRLATNHSSGTRWIKPWFDEVINDR